MVGFYFITNLEWIRKKLENDFGDNHVINKNRYHLHNNVILASNKL